MSHISLKLMRVFLACAVLLVMPLTGCVRIPVFVPTGIEQDAVRSKDLCESVVRSAKATQQNFRALLETTLVVSADEAYSFRYAVVGRIPQDMRVDILPTEGAFTLGLLVARGDEVLLIDSQNKKYSVGCRAKDLFERFFGLEGVTPDVVRALILGGVPALQCGQVAAYREESGGLLLVDAGSNYVWEVEEPSGKLRGVELLDSSMKRVYLRAARSYSPAAESIRIEIFSPAKAIAEMHIRKLVHNPKLVSDPFSVQIPAGYSKEGC